MGPGGGMQVGWKKVLSAWKAQAAQKLGGTVQPRDMHITVGKDLAVVQDVEVGKNANAAGAAQKVSIRATNIFRKENGVWKMIGHHTDLLPYVAR
jgi:ketosteroid isomerase-like protein